MPRRNSNQLLSMLLSERLPLEQRAQRAAHMLIEGGDENLAAFQQLLAAAKAGNAENEYKQKLELLEQGPLRMATFQRMAGEGALAGRGSVMLEDGNTAFVTVGSSELAGELRRGDTVLVDTQGRALLHRDASQPETGELARFERRIDGGRVEVTLREQERQIFWITAALEERMDSEDVQPGASLIVCGRRRMAFDVVPPADGLAHYVYLARESVPELNLEDVGAPPAYVQEMIDLVRLEMTQPELRRSYKLYRSVMKLLAGPTGTGKSFSIYALWRELYRAMSDVTGVPMDELPPRVIRLRTPEVLSRWLGDSDKNLDRFFSEVEQLAGDPFLAPDGKTYTLPCLCILEEIDGLARSRGHEPVYDRILTTALERLDTTRPGLRDKLVLFVATTNVPQQVDAAFLRRVGGTIEHFGRLGRSDFAAVLRAQLADRPVATRHGVSADEARRLLVADVVAWLFVPDHADDVQVELTYAGAAKSVRKYRRDFLTPAIVDRAMQMASSSASLQEHREQTATPGLSSELLIAAFEQQFESMVSALHESNVGDYLDLPDGVRVASLRRPRQPTVSAVRLEVGT